jgi:hypothetical protein
VYTCDIVLTSTNLTRCRENLLLLSYSVGTIKYTFSMTV